MTLFGTLYTNNKIYPVDERFSSEELTPRSTVYKDSPNKNKKNIIRIRDIAKYHNERLQRQHNVLRTNLEKNTEKTPYIRLYVFLQRQFSIILHKEPFLLRRSVVEQLDKLNKHNDVLQKKIHKLKSDIQER